MKHGIWRSLAVVGTLMSLVALSGCADTSNSGGGGGGGGDKSAADATPPGISHADYKALKIGATRQQVFSRFGRSDFAEGPSPATSKVLAERCYTYAIKGEAFSDTQSPSWWLCFDGIAPQSKLVHKEKQ